MAQRTPPGGINEVTTKASILVLLALSAVLLTGCNIASGHDSRAVQVIGDKSKGAGERQDIESSETAAAQLREDARLANERAKLAEERAEFEKQKRELAEERLKVREETNEAENSSKLEKTSGLNETYSHSSRRSRPRQTSASYSYSPTVYEYTYDEGCEVPDVGDTFECQNGDVYEIISREGSTIEYVEVNDN